MATWQFMQTNFVCPTLGKTSVDPGVHELQVASNHASTLAQFVLGA
jgi:hypothetical protein